MSTPFHLSTSSPLKNAMFQYSRSTASCHDMFPNLIFLGCVEGGCMLHGIDKNVTRIGDWDVGRYERGRWKRKKGKKEDVGEKRRNK
jgi:hypothetical protein